MGSAASLAPALGAVARDSSNDDIKAALLALPRDERKKLEAAVLSLGADNPNGECSKQTSLPAPIEKVLREQFGLFDLDGSGYMELDEALVCFKTLAERTNASYDEKHSKESFDKLNRRGTGKVTLADFLAYYEKSFRGRVDTMGGVDALSARISRLNLVLKERNQLSQPLIDALRDLFNIYDVDGNGSISPDEDKRIAALIDPGGAYDKKAFASTDVNGDGVISFAEFLEFFRSTFTDMACDEAVVAVREMCDDLKAAEAKGTEPT